MALVGVCELLGASVFVTTVVVGAVALLHPASVRPQVRPPILLLPPTKSQWTPPLNPNTPTKQQAFARDILFQVLANLLLTASALFGRVTAGVALSYLGLYTIYVLVVLYLDRAQRRAAHGCVRTG